MVWKKFYLGNVKARVKIQNRKILIKEGDITKEAVDAISKFLQ